MKHTLTILIFALSLCVPSFASTEIISLESKNGKSMSVFLVARQGEKVVIQRVKDNKKFTISPDSLSDKSKQLLLDKMKKLKVAYPPLDASVTIGKRRKYDKGSYYMKQMTITAKTTVTSRDRRVPCPPCTMNIVFIGQDQRSTDQFIVLSNQNFKITPTPDSKPVESTPFVTKYDSDNKGDGNIGGYKYVGYLLVVVGSDGEVKFTKTTSPIIKKALETDVTAATKIKAYSKDTPLDKNMGVRKNF